jgi:hypothetical protein
MKKIVYIFSILYILSIVFHVSVALASWNAYVIGAGVKYRPWDTVPTNTSLTINAVRGQWASFQIACRISHEDVSGVDVSITTPFNGSLSLNAPIIYKEVTYNVIKKSRDDGAAGEWPDPLIPKVDPFYSEKRNAFPFNVGRVSPVYNVFDFNIASSNPVTRNNVAKQKPTIRSSYAGTSPLNYHIKIDSAGGLGVATFKWSDTGGASWNQASIKTGSSIPLNNGLHITFPSQTYTLNDEWEFFANSFRNEMVWVDCYIPPEAVPGDFTSVVTVSANGKSNSVLNVTIRVNNITIPKTSSIPIYYQGSRDNIAKGHFQSFQGFTMTYENLYKKYVESALNHRISLMGMAPGLTWDGTAIGGWETHKTWISPYMNGSWSGGSSLSAYQLPKPSGMRFAPIVNTGVKYEDDLAPSEKNYLGSLDDYLIKEGWLSKVFLVLAEEPTISAILNTAVNTAGASIHAINSGYKCIATKRYVAEYKEIDVWVPGIYQFGNYPRSLYDSELAKGKQLWAYRSCMSKGCNITGDATYNKWPSDMVDATLPNLRGYYWLLFDNDIYGDLYYQVVDGYRSWISSFDKPSPYDPWDSIFDFGGDGDGTHFFPGRPDKIGGTTHIPIETLRLKAIRMGLEDYEIFKFAADRCYSTYLKTQIETAVGNGKYYYTSPQPSNAAMEAARNNIISLFSSSPPSGVTKDPSCSQSALPSPPPTITPTPTPKSTSSPTPTPTSTNTTGNKEGWLKNKKCTLQIFFGLAYVNADGSPIGNVKGYEVSAIDSGSNPTNSSTPSNSNVQVFDASNIPALDSDSQIKSSSRSFWSSEVDGKQVGKGGVGEVLLLRTKSRNILTNIEGQNLISESNEFAIENEKLTPELLGLSPGDVAGRENLIQYIHGYDSNVDVKDKSDLKKRKWMLGAIVNSRPLVIPYEDSRSVIYVGANDSMLHAFDNATGEELWGFIPYELLGRLKELSQNNALKYFVDGSPKAYITESQKIIIFGLGKGGSHYYALDVTNPVDPKFLWKIGPETTGFSELGQAWSTPQIGKVKYETGERVVCFIGGGYDENQSKMVATDKKGRAVYAIDVITGNLIWRWDHGKDGNMNFSIPSDISCVDTNGDGYIDRLYVGDTGGRLWRFDIKESGPNSWSAKMIFDTNTNIIAGSKRKIFYRPDVTLEKGYEMVFFGTGDREHPDEIKAINQIYAIKDRSLDKPISMSNLENVTFGVVDLKSLESKDGWFINLEGNKGEKVLGPPVVIFGVTYFSTFTPSIGDVNGTAQLYALDYKNGDPILNLNLSNDRDGVKIDLSDRSKVIGTGIPSNTVISALDSLPIAFTGFSGGVYNTPLRKNSTIIPIWWKEVSKK